MKFRSSFTLNFLPPKILGFNVAYLNQGVCTFLLWLNIFSEIPKIGSLFANRPNYPSISGDFTVSAFYIIYAKIPRKKIFGLQNIVSTRWDTRSSNGHSCILSVPNMNRR